ncbi:MAG TPA: TonB-dependent receptor plug domain-containing protein, partial [Rhodocyclaceae bacterium]
MSRSLCLTALAATLATTISAAASDENAIVVTANRFSTKDVEAPYASEVHTRAQIESSGAVSLYDYLGKQTSVVVAPSFGNRASPRLDLRGYGIETGHQNVAIIVDGVRLNGIDLATPLLGGIALDDVERIEISKGSGVVTHGDGAMAGTIQIHTRRALGSSASAYAGNFG